MSKRLLRSTLSVSLLKKKPEHSLVVISNQLSHYLVKDRDYFYRCLSKVESGKAELRKMLKEARLAFCTPDDLVNWLYKIKEDSTTETDNLFAEYNASIGMDEKKIDFERAGFLTGIYMEANRYLNIRIAIEPLNKNKPHYAILDRLEQLDETFVNTDNIPGYYSIQKDKKIHKQKFELRNLDDDREEYLALKDKHKVSEGFGDLRYFLSDYHSEFKWDLVKIRPREEIKDFLNFHLKKYSGDPIDFLNHIEFRIMPALDGYAGSNYPIFQILIQDWLKEKRNKLNQKNEEYLLESVVSVSASFVENVTEYRKSKDENKYNILICSFLNQRFSEKGWSAKDQSMGGTTDSESRANKAGIAFRDIIVTDEKNNHISAMECLRLYSVPKNSNSDSIIDEHLKKIFRNEPLGLSPLFILVYCETESFATTWKKYLNYMGEINFHDYKLNEVVKQVQINPERANIKIAKAKHKRETSEINVYHIFINMFP